VSADCASISRSPPECRLGDTLRRTGKQTGCRPTPRSRRSAGPLAAQKRLWLAWLEHHRARISGMSRPGSFHFAWSSSAFPLPSRAAAAPGGAVWRYAAAGHVLVQGSSAATGLRTSPHYDGGAYAPHQGRIPFAHTSPRHGSGTATIGPRTDQAARQTRRPVRFHRCRLHRRQRSPQLPGGVNRLPVHPAPVSRNTSTASQFEWRWGGIELATVSRTRRSSRLLIS